MSDLPMLEEIGVGAEFISVALSYHDPLVFPLEEGLQYIRSLRKGLLLTSKGYGEDEVKTLHRFSTEIKVNFYSKEAIQELIASQNLLLRDKDND